MACEGEERGDSSVGYGARRCYAVVFVVLGVLSSPYLSSATTSHQPSALTSPTFEPTTALTPRMQGDDANAADKITKDSPSNSNTTKHEQTADKWELTGRNPAQRDTTDAGIRKTGVGGRGERGGEREGRGGERGERGGGERVNKEGPRKRSRNGGQEKTENSGEIRRSEEKRGKTGDAKRVPARNVKPDRKQEMPAADTKENSKAAANVPETKTKRPLGEGEDKQEGNEAMEIVMEGGVSGDEGEGEMLRPDEMTSVVDLRRVLPEANLDTNVTDVFFSDGQVAMLPCKFPQLSTLHQALLLMQVSWIRRSDWQILTTGVFTYTSDGRFSVLHRESSDDWTLQIKYVKLKDNGTYECQMYTGTGVLSQFVNLHVTTPRAAILGPRALHVQEGDTITLICVIQQGRPPFVFWYHGKQMVNYDTRLKVETHVEGIRTHSRLTISHAKTWDTGNYSCIPPNVEPAFVLVYVNEAGDDAVAAVQKHPTSNSASHSSTQYSSSFISLLLATLLCRVISCRSSVR